MRRATTTILIVALLFAGLITVAGGHTEAWQPDGEAVLQPNGSHADGLLGHGGGDHCCHSVAHFLGFTPGNAAVVAYAPPSLTAVEPAAVPIKRSSPPLPKPPRA